MTPFNTTPPAMTRTLRVLAHLLRYPDAELCVHLDGLRDAIRAERALSEARFAEVETLIHRLATAPEMHAEAIYVDLFDRGRGTSLHLFEHVHGDSRDRGPAMVDLIKTYEAAGLLLAPGELPDHLAVVLEYASTQPPRAAREFLGEIAHIVRAIFNALRKRRSPYAHVLAAVLELAGEPAADAAERIDVADELPLDETWEEPAAFGGCSSAGQAKPNQLQPIRIVKPNAAQQGARA